MDSIATTSDAARRLIEQLDQLRDVLIEEAVIGERDRKLSERVVARLKELGYLWMWVPRSVGGLEISFVDGLKVIEALARIDPASAWVLFVISGSNFAAARATREAVEKIYASPNSLLCGSLNPPGAAQAVDGGFRLSGRWPFTSGIDHANWLLCSAMVSGPSGFSSVLCFFPAAAAKVHDTWKTLGLCATGSNDIEVSDLFVPEHMTFRVGTADDPRSSHHQGHLYQAPLGGGIGSPIAAVALGIARSAIDYIVGVSSSKTSVGRSGVLRDQPVMQSEIAKAEAKVRSARSWLYETAHAVTSTAQASKPISKALRADLLLATAHATQAAASALDCVHQIAGGSAIYRRNPLDRQFRDMHTLMAHRRGAPLQFEVVGRVMFGLEPSDPSLFQ